MSRYKKLYMKRISYLFIIGLFLTLISSGYSVTDEDLRDGVIAYYPFDEGTGTTAYDIVSNQDLTLNGGYTWNSTGLINSSLRFDGASGTAVDGDFTHNDHTIYTLSLWINFTTLSSSPVTRIYSKGDPNLNNNGVRVGFSSDNILGFGFGDGNIQFSYNISDITDGEWHNLHVDRYGRNIQDINVYIDNELLSVSDVVNPTGTLNFYDGLYFASNIGNSEYAPIELDEVVVYNRSLTTDERTELYNRQLNDLSGSQYNFTSQPSIDLTINNPIQDFNYTYDVEEILLNVTTNINATYCNYTYEDNTYPMTQENLTHYTALFDMGEANESTQEFNIGFNCYEETYNSSDTDNVTFYRQQVPLDLQIFVPEDEQEFSRDTNQIEFYIETNYQANCSYLVYNMTDYELFNLTEGSIHKTNYSAFYPNISQYNTSFNCEGLVVNENVTRNVTFYLTDDEIIDEEGYAKIEETTSGMLSVLGNLISNTSKLIVENISVLVIASMIIFALLLITSLIVVYVRDTLNSSTNQKKK